MSLGSGQTLILDGIEYTVVRSLGAGHVADAYLVDALGLRLVLKLLHPDRSPDGAEAAGLKQEAVVLAKLNEAEMPGFTQLNHPVQRLQRAMESAAQRLIVAQIAGGMDDSGRPYAVQEVAPPEVAIQPVKNLQDERRVLLVMQRVADALQLAHSLGIAFEDFKPPSKVDRIRVDWSADGTVPSVRIIDWNISGDSRSFTQDLFYFGGHLFLLLLGIEPEIEDGRPAHNLGAGVAGWNELSQVSKGLLSRLLHRDESKRYLAAAELADDLHWLVGALDMQHSAAKLRELAFTALGQRRPDRVLAAADTALRSSLSAEDERTFRNFQDQARNEMEKETRRSLRMIEISLSTGQYPQAVKEAERELSYLDKRSDLAHRVRFLGMLGQLGAELRSSGKPDPRGSDEWRLAEAGVQRLAEFNWREADQEFEQLARRQSAWSELPAFVTLHNQARAGVLAGNAGQLRKQAQAKGGDFALTPSLWREKETAKIELLQQAEQVLKQAASLAPTEVLFGDALQSLQRELIARTEHLPQLGEARQAWEDQRFTEAETLLADLLAVDPQNKYALELWENVQRKANFAKLRQQGLNELQQAKYSEALSLLRSAANLVAEDEQTTQGLELATWGAAVQKRLRDTMERSRNALHAGRLLEAREDQRWIKSFHLASFAEVQSKLKLEGIDEEALKQTRFEFSAVYSQMVEEISQAVDQAVSEELGKGLQRSDRLWQELKFASARDEIERSKQKLDSFLDEGQQKRLKQQGNRAATALQLMQTLQNQLDALKSRQIATAQEKILADLYAVLQPVQKSPDIPSSLKDVLDALRAAADSPSAAKDKIQRIEGISLDWNLLDSVKSLFIAVFTASQSQAEQREKAKQSLSRAQGVLTDSALLDSTRETEAMQALRMAWNLIPHDDTSTQAQELRSTVAELWSKAVRRSQNREVALKLAQEGETLFKSYSLKQTLRSERQTLEIAARLGREDQALTQATTDREQWDTLPALAERVTETLRELATAANTHSWPEMRAVAQTSDEQVVTVLRSVLNELLNVVKQPAVARQNYEQRAWAATLGKEVLISRGGNKIPSNYSQAFAEAEQSSQTVLTVYQKLTELQRAMSENGALGNDGVRHKITELHRLKSSAIEWPADLQASLDALDLAQAGAVVARRTVASDSSYPYITVVEALLSWLAQSAPEQADKISLGLVAQAHEKVQKSVIDRAGTLAEALQVETGAWFLRAEPSADGLLALFWQARWMLTALVATPPLSRWNRAKDDLEAALEAASSGLLKPLRANKRVHNYLAEAFAGESEALRYLERLTSALKAWRTAVETPPFDLPKQMGSDGFQARLTDAHELMRQQRDAYALSKSAEETPLAERLEQKRALAAFFQANDQDEPLAWLSAAVEETTQTRARLTLATDNQDDILLGEALALGLNANARLMEIPETVRPLTEAPLWEQAQRSLWQDLRQALQRSADSAILAHHIAPTALSNWMRHVAPQPAAKPEAESALLAALRAAGDDKAPTRQIVAGWQDVAALAEPGGELAQAAQRQEARSRRSRRTRLALTAAAAVLLLLAGGTLAARSYVLSQCRVVDSPGCAALPQSVVSWLVAPTATPTLTPTATLTSTATPSPSPTGTATHTATFTPTPTPVPPTATPVIAGALPCTLSLTGLDSDTVQGFTPFVVEPGKLTTTVTWGKITLFGGTCTEEDLGAIEARSYRLVLRKDTSSSLMLPEEMDFRITGDDSSSLTISGELPLMVLAPSGQAQFDVQYKTDDQDTPWQPVQRLILALSWNIATATPTAAATATPAATPIATPTATPAATPTVPAVTLLSPEDGFQTSDKTVTFQWQASGPLPEGTCFEIIAWQEGASPQALTDAANTCPDKLGAWSADTPYNYTIDITRLASGELYRWDVIVAELNPYKRLTQAGPGRKITYSSGGGSNGTPPP